MAIPKQYTYSTASKAAESDLKAVKNGLNYANEKLDKGFADLAIGNLDAAKQNYKSGVSAVVRAIDSNDAAGVNIAVMKETATNNVERATANALGVEQSKLKGEINATDAKAEQLLSGIELKDAQNQNSTRTPNKTPKDSAGDEVKAESTAAADGSRTQNPPTGNRQLNNDDQVVPVTGTDTSNANRTPTANNANLGQATDISVVGAERPVVTQRQTQSGASNSPDDNTQQKRTAVGTSTGVDGRPSIPAQFTSPIVATPNPLAKLASMTYSISIYLMNIDEYQTMLASQKKVLPTQELIIQSGGIPNQTEGVRRNEYFDVDFYIDDLQIKSLVTGKTGSSAAHNNAEIKFSIFEPAGITFLQRLKAAIQKHNGGGNGNAINEFSQNYLMIVRFYGYDDTGRLISGATLDNLEQRSDQNSIVEKWIPFQFASIRYKIDTKVTEYQCVCTTPQTSTAFSQGFGGTIPFNIELSSATVQDILNGEVLESEASIKSRNPNPGNESPRSTTANPPGTPPPKANTAPTKTITQGLCKALNQYYKELAEREGYEIPDEFVIILDDVPGLKDAKMAKPGGQVKSKAPMNKNISAASKWLSSKTSYDKNTKNYSIVAGTQIAQVIDLVMRSSSYITSQQSIIFDETSGEIIQQGAAVETVQWYRIRSRVEPLGYDRKRKNIAYRIIYTISQYQINNPRSAYFPNAKYRGAHKIYNWWFTGQNSEVLDFDIDINANYFEVIGTDGKSPPPEEVSSGRWSEKRALQTRPNEASKGGEGESTMAAANLAARLYSQADVAKNELTIVGDPDWIQQSEIFYNKEVNLNPYMPDGSVNFDASEILYELRFNTVTDYNLSDGLAKVYKDNYAQSLITGESNLPVESIVWAAAEVQSVLKQGKFTQRIKGTIMDFAPDDTKDRADLGSNNIANNVNQNAERRTFNLLEDREKELRVALKKPIVPYKPLLNPKISNEALGLNSTLSAPKPKTTSVVINDDALLTQKTIKR